MTQQANAAPLKLFNVTLFWAKPGSDEGDYATSVWAADSDDAIRQVVEEMADSGEKHFECDADRDAYIEEVIANAGQYAAMEAIASMGMDIENLLKGPRGDLTEEAKKDLDDVTAILAKYGMRAR